MSHDQTPIGIDRANQIVSDLFAAAGLSGRDVPALSDDGMLSDGNWEEPAELADEDALRRQCARWIESVTATAG